MSDYPEHEKLSAVKDATQAAGEFMEWLGGQGLYLAKDYMFTKDDEVTDDPAQERYTRTRRSGKSLITLLAEWADIDQNKIEAEKRRMLASLQVPAKTVPAASQTSPGPEWSQPAPHPGGS